MDFRVGDKLQFVATGNEVTVIGPGYTPQRWELRYADGHSIYVDPADADDVMEVIERAGPPEAGTPCVPREALRRKSHETQEFLNLLEGALTRYHEFWGPRFTEEPVIYHEKALHELVAAARNLYESGSGARSMRLHAERRMLAALEPFDDIEV